MTTIRWNDKRWNDHCTRINAAVNLCIQAGPDAFVLGVRRWLRYPLERDASMEAQERALDHAAQDCLWHLVACMERTDMHPYGAGNPDRAVLVATAARLFQSAKSWLTDMWETDTGRA